MFKFVFFAVLLLVTAFLLMPLPEAGEPVINDKVAHGLIFFGLAFLIHRAYPQFRFVTILAPILVTYGFFIEVVQGFSGYRTFSMLDFGADVAGIILYFCACGLMYKIIHIQASRV